MGYMAHHAVLIHAEGYRDNPDLDAFRATLPEQWGALVVGYIPSVVNDTYTAVFLPDGSKEHWAESDDGDRYREQFVELFSERDEDGNALFDVAIVRFGGDEPEAGWLRQPLVDDAT